MIGSEEKDGRRILANAAKPSHSFPCAPDTRTKRGSFRGARSPDSICSPPERAAISLRCSRRCSACIRRSGDPSLRTCWRSIRDRPTVRRTRRSTCTSSCRRLADRRTA
jgi:hypothetical protein